MKRLVRLPSPAMVIACLALFVALSGVSYALATGSIGSREIANGSILNRDFKDGTLRGQEFKPDSLGPKAIKEQVLDSSKLGIVNNAVVAEGVNRQAVVGVNGTTIRARGVASTARSGEGSYQVITDRDVRTCVYSATLGDESASSPGTGQISVTSLASNVNGVRVSTRNSDGALADRSFHLIVSC